MKKCYLSFSVLLAALTWAGCTDDNSETGSTTNKDGQYPISFKTFVDKNTKGTPTASGVLAQDFWVYAYEAPLGNTSSTTLAPDFMFEQYVAHTDSGFSYAPIKFWPASGDLNFYAYTPNSTNMTITNPLNRTDTGYPAFDYTVNDTIASQEDMLVATIESLNNIGGSVNFQFKHAMTQVGFAARTAGDYRSQGVAIKLDSIAISGIINSGSFSYDRFVHNPDSTWWTVGSNRTSYVPSIFRDTVPFYTNPTTYLVVNGGNQYLMAIPQSFANTNAKLDIYYKVLYSDGTPTRTFLKELPLNGTPSWKPGLAIYYTIIISLQNITFNPVVNEWNDSFEHILTLPEPN